MMAFLHSRSGAGVREYAGTHIRDLQRARSSGDSSPAHARRALVDRIQSRITDQDDAMGRGSVLRSIRESRGATIVNRPIQRIRPVQRRFYVYIVVVIHVDVSEDRNLSAWKLVVGFALLKSKQSQHDSSELNSKESTADNEELLAA